VWPLTTYLTASEVHSIENGELSTSSDSWTACGLTVSLLNTMQEVGTLQATTVNLQIVYQCVRTASTYPVCSKTLFVETLEPLLHSEYIQLRLISKALLVCLDLPGDPLTTTEVATLLQFIEVTVHDEVTHSHHLSLINLLSIARDLAKSPKNQGNLASPDVLLRFSKLASELEEDLQQVVAEVIQMVTSNEDPPSPEDQLTMEVDPSYQVEGMCYRCNICACN